MERVVGVSGGEGPGDLDTRMEICDNSTKIKDNW